MDFDPKEWGDDSLVKSPEPVKSMELMFGEWAMHGVLSDVNEWRSVVGTIHDNPELLENNNER